MFDKQQAYVISLRNKLLGDKDIIKYYSKPLINDDILNIKPQIKIYLNEWSITDFHIKLTNENKTKLIYSLYYYGQKSQTSFELEESDNVIEKLKLFFVKDT